MAADRSAGVAVGAFAFLSAVRRADRCARLRTVAARDFRMFFFADAIFGTKKLSRNSIGVAFFANPQPTGAAERSQAGTAHYEPSAALYSPRGRHYLTPVAPPLTRREPPPSPTAVADLPAVP